MTKFDWLKNRIKTLKPLSQKTGYSILHLLFSFELCRHIHGATMEQFLTFRMYDDSFHKQRQYMTLSRCIKIRDYLNRDATQDDYDALGNKQLFVKNYSDFLCREVLYIPDSTTTQIRSFIERNPRFLAKDCDSTQGFGIDFYDRNHLDIEDFLTQSIHRPLLLESFIVQHPALSAVNPDSVNTVRVVTVRHNGQVLILSCFLRVGGVGQKVDNFHHGGVVYPLDIETGTIMHPGKDYLGEHTFLSHPTTGHPMLGFRIPHWEQIIEQTEKIAMRSPHIGFIAWDVAVLEDGIEYVEANVEIPGPTAMQLYGPGIYKTVKDFIHTTS